MIGFASDLYLDHRAVVSMCERLFESMEEMNDIMLRNFNERVRQDDTVYILGDIAHRTPVIDMMHSDIGREVAIE